MNTEGVPMTDVDEEFVPVSERGERYLSLRSRAVRSPGEFVRRDDGSVVMEQWAEMVVPITHGALTGFTARIRLEIIDERVKLTGIEYTPTEPAELSNATNRVLKAVSLGDVMDDIERCLRNIASQTDVNETFRWLDAFLASRKRPGRKGSPEIIWARVAARRVEAERVQPGNATRYMVREWPDEFTSQRSTWGKVNRAIAKGMLVIDDDRKPHLTDIARQLLQTSEDES
jgi:hypothetical protein